MRARWRTRRTHTVVLLSSFFLLAAFIFHAIREYRSKTFHFPDGSQVRVLGVTQGTNSLVYDPLLYRLARKFLPNNLKANIPPPVDVSDPHSDTTDEDTLTVLLYDPTSKSEGSRYPIDQEGNYFFESSNSGGNHGNDFRTFNLHNFPRRQKSFPVALVQGNQTNIINVPNPYNGNFPVWNSEPLPITRSNGPVSLTLTDLTFNQSSPGEVGELSPTFSTATDDPKWKNAQRTGMSIQDPTGNSAYTALSYLEPVWRIRQWVIRTEFADFLPEEIQHARQLTVPQPGCAVPLNLVIRTNNTLIHIWGLAGSGTLQMTNGIFPGSTQQIHKPRRTYITFTTSDSSGQLFGCKQSRIGTKHIETWTFARPAIIYESIGLAASDNCLFFAQGEDSEPAALELPRAEMSSGYRHKVCYQPLPYEPGAVIDLQFILSRGLQFDFYVTPKRPQVPHATD